MIRNLIIIDKNGRALLSANYGDCHALGDDDDLISGFISAVYGFSKVLDAKSLDQIQLGTLTFILMSKGNLVFALSADDENLPEHKTTLVKIIDLFEDLYDYYTVCVEPDIDISVFEEFPKFLVDQEILARNCGKYTECAECPNSTKSLPLDAMTKQLKSV
jgi:hypothetical protein